jgi:peptidoglycan/LPS O-acetylase OafA/YrhL
MKRPASLFWGIALILLSAALLADRLGYIDFAKISDNAWVFITGGAAILFLLSYFLNGVKRWGWLFPAFGFAALSLTVRSKGHSWVLPSWPRLRCLSMSVLLSTAGNGDCFSRPGC